MSYHHTNGYASENLHAFDVRSIARALGGDVVGDQVVAPGPGHSRKDRSLSVRLSATAPDGFLIHSHAGDDWQSCRDYVKERLGIDRDSWRDRAQEIKAEPVEKARTDDGEARRARESAARYVASLAPLLGTPGEDYLRLTRGISIASIKETLATIDAIGWHSSVYFNEPDHPLHKQKLGAVIGIMTDPATGKPTGAISRTYIHEGRKVAKAKTLSSRKGVVRLSPDDEVRGAGFLFVCEGIETALAAMAAGVRPVWACGDAETLGSLPLLPDIDLVVVADNDMSNTGEKAAREVAQRWREAGRNVHIVAPPKAGDFNNISMVTPYFYGEATSGDDWITALADRRGLVVLDPDAPNLELPKTRAEWPTREALADQGGDFISRMFGNNVIDLSEAKTRREVSARIEGLKRIEDDVWGRPDGRDGFARIAEIEARTAEYFGRALGDEGDEAEAPTKLEPAPDEAGDEPKAEASKLDDEPELELFDAGDEDGNLSPREWLLGTAFCRAYLSGLVSAGAAGKTTLRILQALSLATGRPLSGEYVHKRSRVLIVCLEDDMKELRKRVLAARRYYQIDPQEVKGWLILTTPRGLKIAELNGKGGVEDGKLLGAIGRAVDKLKLDVVCIDPAIKAHSLDENSNPQMDAFATRLTHLAQERNIAIDLLYHEKKAGGEAGDVNRSRGAGSVKDAARLMYTLTGMDKEAAGAVGVREEERRFFFRIDSAKVNIAPPDDSTKWFKLIGVHLNNPTDEYPNGDTVQTCTAWEAPAPSEGITREQMREMLVELGRGINAKSKYSVKPQAGPERAAWKLVQKFCPDKSERQCRSIIKTWERDGRFEIGEYDGESRHKETGILSVKTDVFEF